MVKYWYLGKTIFKYYKYFTVHFLFSDTFEDDHESSANNEYCDEEQGKFCSPNPSSIYSWLIKLIYSEQFMYMFTTCSELAIFMYWTHISMNNILSYCGLVDARIGSSEKDEHVNLFQKNLFLLLLCSKIWPTVCKTGITKPKNFSFTSKVLLI